MKTQLAEFENSDFHRMETDRVVRARIDLKGVEDQVCNTPYVEHRTVEHIGDDPRQTKKTGLGATLKIVPRHTVCFIRE